MPCRRSLNQVKLITFEYFQITCCKGKQKQRDVLEFTFNQPGRKRRDGLLFKPATREARARFHDDAIYGWRYIILA